ncbi:collagen alpha-1(XIV) chain-like [Genypterus blacodes]|uniref:collagen alpha-1(XIV) chain-like n=1 Tax=Genypterus blacodes TaxID=154954 RepID=UPI003F757C7E
MSFPLRLSLCLLGFFLVSQFPQPTQGQVSSPRRFRAKVLESGQLSVSWKEPRGEFESYRLEFSSEPGGTQTEAQVSKQESKFLLQNFDPSKEYNFNIVAVGGGQESKPLQAKVEAQRSGSETVQPQRRQDSRVTEETNQIAEGKVVVRETGKSGAVR